MWSRWSTEEVEEVYKEVAEGGLAFYEPLQVTVSIWLLRLLFFLLCLRCLCCDLLCLQCVIHSVVGVRWLWK